MAKALAGLDVATEGQTVTGERTMAATEFRARCYRLMDEVVETGREIVITKRGRPVARLVPYRRRRGAPFGLYRDEIRIYGDIGAPTDVEWEVEENTYLAPPEAGGVPTRCQAISSMAKASE